jgi:glutathione S-transferase
VDISPANAQEEGQALRWSFWTMTEIERDALTVLMHRMAMPAEQRKPELADAAEGRLKAPLRVLEQALQRQHAQGQAHLGADRFTVTDVCVASVVNWVRPAESLMQAYPAVSEWLHQCVNRTAHHSARKLGR